MILIRNFSVLCGSLLLITDLAYSQSCSFVRNLRIRHQSTDSNDWKETTVNGCIDEAVLGATNVREINIECTSRELTDIGSNFLRNLESLEKLVINRCKFETIDPGAFVNLPKLSVIFMFENSLKEIRRGVFDGLPNLTELRLYLNEISYVDDHAFANLPKLSFLDLNDNKFEYMRREWFTNSTEIVTFLMARNALRQIPPRMFEGWKKLNWFNFNVNEISTIHDRAFNDIAPVIKNLDFHLNRLTSLSLKSFSNPLHIEILRISANLFNFIPEELIRNVDIDYLYVHGNPLKCSCLDRLYWLVNQKGGIILDYPDDPYVYKPCYSASAPVCVTPAKFTQFCQDTVDKEATRTYLTYLKKIGYDEIHRFKCAYFDFLTS